MKQEYIKYAVYIGIIALLFMAAYQIKMNKWQLLERRTVGAPPAPVETAEDDASESAGA